MARKKRRWHLPYWLTGGDRTCSACHGSHAHEVEMRCVACDRPYCPFCIVVVAGERFCVECRED